MVDDPANYDDNKAPTEYVWHYHFSLLHPDTKFASKMIEIATTTIDEYGRQIAVSD